MCVCYTNMNICMEHECRTVGRILRVNCQTSEWQNDVCGLGLLPLRTIITGKFRINITSRQPLACGTAAQPHAEYAILTDLPLPTVRLWELVRTRDIPIQPPKAEVSLVTGLLTRQAATHRIWDVTAYHLQLLKFHLFPKTQCRYFICYEATLMATVTFVL